MSKTVFNQIKDLTTEARNPRTENIDSLSIPQILKLINREDEKVANSVERILPAIAKGVDLIVDSFKKGGRLFYVGAGTSGRLGVLDAAECPPTFGTSPSLIKGIIAGGKRSLILSREGAEDDRDAGRLDIRKNKIRKGDVVVGIAASKRTPYVLAALRESKRIGAGTIFVFCNPPSPSNINVDVSISPLPGPEAIMGSTRMKAGTAQKMILNMLTTASMIRLGKVYGNMMVDLRATSEKLLERSKRIVMLATKVSYKQSELYLKRADGSVKTAIVMILAKVDKHEAQQRLARNHGFVRKAIGDSHPGEKWSSKAS